MTEFCHFRTSWCCKKSMAISWASIRWFWSSSATFSRSRPLRFQSRRREIIEISWSRSSISFSNASPTSSWARAPFWACGLSIHLFLSFSLVTQDCYREKWWLSTLGFITRSSLRSTLTAWTTASSWQPATSFPPRPSRPPQSTSELFSKRRDHLWNRLIYIRPPSRWKHFWAKVQSNN